jgi:fatty-acyl-CoA synthase
MAAVVLRDGATLTPDELGEFLARQPDLSPKAWPRHVRLSKELPSTATNKVLKRSLVAEGTATSDPVWTRRDRHQNYELLG